MRKYNYRILLLMIFVITIWSNLTIISNADGVLRIAGISELNGTYCAINDPNNTLIQINNNSMIIFSRYKGENTTTYQSAKPIIVKFEIKNNVAKITKGYVGNITKTSSDTYTFNLGSKGIFKTFKAKDLKTALNDKRVTAQIELEKKAISTNVGEENINKTKPDISPELQEIIDSLKAKIKIEDDLTLFTLYAFMNYTGYDDENSRNGFHIARKKVREELFKRNIKLNDNRYYANKKISWSYYGVMLSLMDENFNYVKPVPEYMNGLSDLNEALKDFSAKVDIKDLYSMVRQEYHAEFRKYDDSMYLELAKIIEYLRIDISTNEKFYVTVNLLDAYERGSGLSLVYAHKSNLGMIVTGPSDTPNTQNIIHEYLHGVFKSIQDKHWKEMEKIKQLRESIPYSSQSLAEYQQFLSIFSESLIRAITPMYQEGKNFIIQNEMKRGFVYTKYFSDKFTTEYPGYKGSLEEFIVKLVEDLQ